MSRSRIRFAIPRIVRRATRLAVCAFGLLTLASSPALTSVAAGVDTAHPGAFGPREVWGANSIEAFAEGDPPVRWADELIPVSVCTHHANRPAWMTANQFRAAVLSGAEMWNRAGAAVGLRYAGDCDAGAPWDNRNGLNEIGFDTPESEVEPPSAAVSRGRWSTVEDDRYFAEVDIIIDRDEALSDVCLRSVIAHELGHVLGFGHSENPHHLMRRSFTPSDPSTCILEATDEERQWLTALYGSNLPPVLSAPDVMQLSPGEAVSLKVGASSSHAGLLYRWTQISGDKVDFTATGPSISFVAPGEPGAELQFSLEVFDPYLAKATATVSAVVESPPASPPSALEAEPSFHPVPVDSGLTLTMWQGGGYEVLASALGPDGSAWMTVGGAFLGFHGGAPAFVNARFIAAMPNGLPEGWPLLVVQ